MRKIKIIFLILLLTGIRYVAADTRINVAALVMNPSLFDGKTVMVEGEFVGDIIEGKDGFWVNLLDFETAIGLWCPMKEKEKIRFLGRYNVKGDYVRAIGIFHNQCQQHNGDIDIHVISLTLLEQGQQLSEKVSLEEVLFAIFLGIVSLFAIGILHILSRREGRSDKQKFSS